MCETHLPTCNVCSEGSTEAAEWLKGIRVGKSCHGNHTPSYRRWLEVQGLGTVRDRTMIEGERTG